jgi:hypothetical protein
MKKIISLFLIIQPVVLIAQTKIYTNAIINTTTNIIAPEDEEVQNIQQEPRGGMGMSFRNMMDGEIKSVTFLRNELVKTDMQSEMGKSSIIRDNIKKITTTIITFNGETNAFFVTDEEQVEMQKRRDSMMAERRKRDTTNRQMPNMDRNNFPVEISVTEESRKIAGYDCKKAYLITSRLLGIKDTSVIWYTAQFKLQNVLSTGGMGNMPGMGNFGGSLNGLDKVDGFVMRYETKMRRNRKMEVEVTKVELDAKIEDKTFSLPKGVELKPMSEMGGMFRGGFRGRD